MKGLFVIAFLLMFATSGISAVLINGNSNAYLQEFYYFTVTGLTEQAVSRECDVYSTVEGVPVFATMDKKVITDDGQEEKMDYVVINSNMTMGTGRFFFTDQYFTKGSYNLSVVCPGEDEATKEIAIPSELYRPLFTKTMGYSIFGVTNAYSVLQVIFGIILGWFAYSCLRDVIR